MSEMMKENMCCKNKYGFVSVIPVGVVSQLVTPFR